MIPKIHPEFKFNGLSLNHDGMMAIAYSYVKEGNAWEKEIGDFILNWLDNFEVMTVYTSGSTGAPTSYKLNKKKMINSAILTGERFKLPYGTIALCCLPLNYIAGKMMLVRAMHLGWQIDTLEPSITPLVKATKRYDFTAMTAMQVANSLPDIHKSRKILLGGGPVSDALVESLAGKHTRVYHSYGMTETCSHVAVRELYPNYEPLFTAVGEASFNTTASGCLIINAPDVTDHELETTDIVELVSNSQFTIIGRADDVINTGGVKIHPETVENKLAGIIDNRFFIAGIHDEELGQRVVLIVESSDDTLTFDFKKLEKFEIPRAMHTTPAFIETHTKKIDKRAVLAGLGLE